MANVAILGSTGLVGGHVLATALKSNSIENVHTISRRAPKTEETSKLTTHVEADTAKWASILSTITPKPDIVISALGTTRAQAGGVENQWKIDHDLNIELAKAAHAAGVKTYVFVSSAGIRSMIASSLPYSKMKQGVEDSIQTMGFEQAIILRPGMILGEREVPKNPVSMGIVRGLGRHVSQGLQDKIGQEADVIGRAALKAALVAIEGRAPGGGKFWVLEAAEIPKYGVPGDEMAGGPHKSKDSA